MPWNAIGNWLSSHAQLPLRGERRLASPNDRLRWILVVTALASIWIAETLARLSLPMLVRDHPPLLIMLDARTHDLLLASTKVSTAEFIVVAVVWRFSVHSLYFLAGRWYGESALQWITSRSKLGKRILPRVDRAFRRASAPAVFLLSDKIVCVLAGSAGMGLAAFLGLHFVGTVLHVVAISIVARSNHARLSWIVQAVDGNAGWLTVVTVVGTIAMIVVAARIRRNGLREPKGVAAPSGSVESASLGLPETSDSDRAVSQDVPWVRGRMFRSGVPLDQAVLVTDRVVTVPNGITLVRLLALPLFAYLALARHAWSAACALFVVIAVLDVVDGYVARRFDQATKLGSRLDPLTDRAAMVTVSVTLVVAHVIPLPLAALLMLRDVLVVGIVGVCILVGRPVPVARIPVTRTGKVATLVLLVSLPLLLLARVGLPGGSAIHLVALSLACVGAVLYYGAFGQYVKAGLDAR